MPKIAVSSIDSPNNQFIDNFARSVRHAGFATVKTPFALKDFRDISAAIYHWPAFLSPSNPFWASIRSLVKLTLARNIFGTKVIWVAHNATPHEGGTNLLIGKLFFSQLDAVVYFSERSRSIVREANPISSKSHELITVHGLYESSRPIVSQSRISDGEACRLICFGQIRPYKGLERLIAEAHKSRSDLHLTILGKVGNAAYAKLLESLVSKSRNVHLDIRNDMVPDAELEWAIDNSHGVVLPYRKILNSGAAIHALSRNRSVLVPGQGSMPELQEMLGKSWVRTFDDEISRDDIDSFVDALRARTPEDLVDMTSFRWQRITEDLSRLFAGLRISN